MVWELAKELVSLGQEVTVISPYYNVGPKGETNHLREYGIEHGRSIDVYDPDKYEVGLHYGVVDGSGSFLATPYPTVPTFYTIVFAKVSLEFLCQKCISAYVKEKVSNRY